MSATESRSGSETVEDDANVFAPTFEMHRHVAESLRNAEKSCSWCIERELPELPETDEFGLPLLAKTSPLHPLDSVRLLVRFVEVASNHSTHAQEAMNFLAVLASYDLMNKDRPDRRGNWGLPTRSQLEALGFRTTAEMNRVRQLWPAMHAYSRALLHLTLARERGDGDGARAKDNVDEFIHHFVYEVMRFVTPRWDQHEPSGKKLAPAYLAYQLESSVADESGVHDAANAPGNVPEGDVPELPASIVTSDLKILEQARKQGHLVVPYAEWMGAERTRRWSEKRATAVASGNKGEVDYIDRTLAKWAAEYRDHEIYKSARASVLDTLEGKRRDANERWSGRHNPEDLLLRVSRSYAPTLVGRALFAKRAAAHIRNIPRNAGPSTARVHKFREKHGAQPPPVDEDEALARKMHSVVGEGLFDAKRVMEIFGLGHRTQLARAVKSAALDVQYEGTRVGEKRRAFTIEDLVAIAQTRRGWLELTRNQVREKIQQHLLSRIPASDDEDESSASCEEPDRE